MAEFSNSGYLWATSVVVGALPILLFLGVYAYSKWLYSHSKGDAKVPKGSWLVVPFVGETVQMLTSNPDAFFTKRHQKYGGIYTTHLFGQPTIAAATPEAQKFFLSSKSFQMSMSPTFQKVMGSEGITQLQGNMHARVRKMILSVVATEFLKKFVSSIDQIAQDFLHSFNEGDTINTLEEMKKFTFSISSLLVCDHLTPTNPSTQELKRLLHYVEEGLFCLEIDLPGTTFRKAIQARKAVIKLLDQLIAQRRSEGGHHSDMLQMFLEPGEEPLTDAQIRDNLLSVVFASHDTSALTLTWMFKMLNENPHLLQQVQEEHEAIARQMKPGQLLTLEHLKDMQLSLRVILETLRISNIIPLTLREATQDVEYNGHLIPKGWKVLINFRYLHVGPDNHHLPFTFDPARFEEQPKPGTFTPFGGGIRLCPGNDLAKQEMLIFMHRFLTTFRYKQAGPDQGIKYFPMPIPKGGFPMKLTAKYGH